MFCPKCKGDTFVYGKRNMVNGVLRYRKCSVCGHKFHTEERYSDKYLKEAVKNDLQRTTQD